MVSTYRLNANELTLDLLNAIRLVFKDKEIEINISEAMDETEYLLSSPANKAHLLESIKQLENGEGITMSMEEFQQKYGA